MYGLRTSKWKAGVRRRRARNHFFPDEISRPSPIKSIKIGVHQLALVIQTRDCHAESVVVSLVLFSAGCTLSFSSMLPLCSCEDIVWNGDSKSRCTAFSNMTNHPGNTYCDALAALSHWLVNTAICHENVMTSPTMSSRTQPGFERLVVAEGFRIGPFEDELDQIRMVELSDRPQVANPVDISMGIPGCPLQDQISNWCTRYFLKHIPKINILVGHSSSTSDCLSRTGSASSDIAHTSDRLNTGLYTPASTSQVHICKAASYEPPTPPSRWLMEWLTEIICFNVYDWLIGYGVSSHIDIGYVRYAHVMDMG